MAENKAFSSFFSLFSSFFSIFCLVYENKPIYLRKNFENLFHINHLITLNYEQVRIN